MLQSKINGTTWSLSSLSFSFSKKNKFTVLGCDDYALIIGNFSTGCFGVCPQKGDVPDDGQCSGMGCCQTSIQTGMNFFNVKLGTLGQHKTVSSFSRCGVAFLGEEGTFNFRGLRDLSDPTGLMKRINSTVPLVLDWVIAPGRNCTNATECRGNSSCVGVKGGGYHCRCNKGYEGNPYLDPGCQDINECEVQNHCHGICINTQGGYDCTCPRGQIGNPNIINGCVHVDHSKLRSILAFSLIAVAMGIAILSISFWMLKAVQMRKLNKQREKYFKRNGGGLLQHRRSNGNEIVDQIRLISATELERSTGNFSDDRKVGQGAVYKGMLADGLIVAIKKLTLVDESRVETFINEVLILSEITHKNVVKLLGCCLETEVPMLVYEFIPNGTLADFIHDEDYEFPIFHYEDTTFWKIRLQIATEIARGLAYLHSRTSITVFHRDIKSSNILLDEKFRAKISDFGISKDETHVSSLAKGTMGYLDPEYNQSNHLTDKSDVYSFGIVLLELLTGKKPIFMTPSGVSTGLATFILPMNDEQILQNVDNRVSKSPKKQLVAFANLAKRCLDLNGTLRPNMEEVATILEDLRKSG